MEKRDLGRERTYCVWVIKLHSQGIICYIIWPAIPRLQLFQRSGIWTLSISTDDWRVCKTICTHNQNLATNCFTHEYSCTGKKYWVTNCSFVISTLQHTFPPVKLLECCSRMFASFWSISQAPTHTNTHLMLSNATLTALTLTPFQIYTAGPTTLLDLSDCSPPLKSSPLSAGKQGQVLPLRPTETSLLD